MVTNSTAGVNPFKKMTEFNPGLFTFSASLLSVSHQLLHAALTVCTLTEMHARKKRQPKTPLQINLLDESN